jgi:homoserine dehydrogenase
VLASVAGVLGTHAISISSVLQHESSGARHVLLTILTHAALERNMRAALEEISRLGVVRGKPVCVRVIDQEGGA